MNGVFCALIFCKFQTKIAVDSHKVHNYNKKYRLDNTYSAAFVMDIEEVFLLAYGKNNILEGFQNTVMGFVFFMRMLYVYAKIYHKELMFLPTLRILAFHNNFNCALIVCGSKDITIWLMW